MTNEERVGKIACGARLSICIGLGFDLENMIDTNDEVLTSSFFIFFENFEFECIFEKLFEKYARINYLRISW